MPALYKLFCHRGALNNKLSFDALTIYTMRLFTQL